MANNRFMRRLIYRTRAVATIVASLLMMTVIVITVSLTLTVVQSNLNLRNAENDFNSAKTSMKLIGLAVDDVAWIPARAQTIQLIAQNGIISLPSATLTYTIQVRYSGTPSYQKLASYEVGVLLFNIPLLKYRLENNYYENILNESALQQKIVSTGPQATVTQVFAIQKNPMYDGEFIRVCVAPIIRYITSSFYSQQNSTFQIKLYLPNLTPETTQTATYITVSGKSLNAISVNGIDSVKVTVGFPKDSLGFNNGFFHFANLEETISIPAGYTQTAAVLYYSEVYTKIN